MCALKIYFCGSIRGGRADAELYSQIIAHLKTLGTVLTEHVGNPDCKIDKVESLELPEGPERDKQIFETDMGWLHQSDVVVAEVTQVSSGVGFELGVAWKLEKPVLAIYRPSAGKSLSAMIGGAFGERFQVVRYSTLEEVKPAIAKLCSQFGPKP